MKIFITGASGQLGRELLNTCPIASKNSTIKALTSSQLDITQRQMTLFEIDGFKPDLIINCAAYTAVDRAENEPDRALEVNAIGVENLAIAAEKIHARLIHISTDFVFDGKKSAPYEPQDATNPIGVYGQTKLEGEKALQKILPDRSIVLRTSWLYSSNGHNFVKTMLRLMAERSMVSVVADQVGSPTWANGLARTIWAFALKPELRGIYHWSDAGVASWYDFAQAIFEEARTLGILKAHVDIAPIKTQEYPTPARRPYYSVLDTTSARRTLGIKPSHWRVELRKMLKELSNKSH